MLNLNAGQAYAARATVVNTSSVLGQPVAAQLAVGLSAAVGSRSILSSQQSYQFAPGETHDFNFPFTIPSDVSGPGIIAGVLTDPSGKALGSASLEVNIAMPYATEIAEVLLTRGIKVLEAQVSLNSAGDVVADVKSVHGLTGLNPANAWFEVYTSPEITVNGVPEAYTGALQQYSRVGYLSPGEVITNKVVVMSRRQMAESMSHWSFVKPNQMLRLVIMVRAYSSGWNSAGNSPPYYTNAIAVTLGSLYYSAEIL